MAPAQEALLELGGVWEGGRLFINRRASGYIDGYALAYGWMAVTMWRVRREVGHAA